MIVHVNYGELYTFKIKCSFVHIIEIIDINLGLFTLNLHDILDILLGLWGLLVKDRGKNV